MQVDPDIVEKVARSLAKRSETAFAYLHGSTLSSPSPRDVDVAIYLHREAFEQLASAGKLHMEFTIPVELELARELGIETDVQVLNNAPLPFRFRVVSSGALIVEDDSIQRIDFESLTRCKYFDFSRCRAEYMAEVTT